MLSIRVACCCLLFVLPIETMFTSMVGATSESLLMSVNHSRTGGLVGVYGLSCFLRFIDVLGLFCH